MVRSDAFRTHIETTPTHKPIIPIDPNRKVLPRFRPLDIDMHAFDSLPSSRSAVQKHTQEDLETRPLTVPPATVRSEEDNRRLGHSEIALPQQCEPGCQPRNGEGDNGYCNGHPFSHRTYSPAPPTWTTHPASTAMLAGARRWVNHMRIFWRKDSHSPSFVDKPRQAHAASESRLFTTCQNLESASSLPSK